MSTLAEIAAKYKATSTPSPTVAPEPAPAKGLDAVAQKYKATAPKVAPAPKPPEVKATPVAKPKPVAPVVVTAPKAAPPPAPAPVVATAPATPAAFTPVPVEQWIKMTPEQRQGALATRAAQPGFTSTLTRLEAESAPPPVAAKPPAASATKPIKPAPEFYPGEETPVPTLLSPAPAFLMGPDGKPVTDWRMPTAEEQAHAEAQKGRAQIETDLAIAKKRLAEQEASHRFGEAPWWLPGTDPLVTARDEVRHLEALKAQGVDPLRPPSASEELVAGAKALHKYLTTSPEDKPLSADAVETEIANRRAEAQRMGQTLPDPRDENRFREDNRVRRQQLELSQAASARQSYEEQALAAKNDPYKLAAIQNEEATRLGVVSRAVARVVPQAVIDGRAAMLNISAKAQLDPDPTSAGQKFLKEASDYIYAQGQADAPNTDEGRAALRARANAGAWDMLLSLRQQGPQFWPYPIHERDFVPASERTYWGTAKDILLPEVETVPGGGAVRTQGLVSHAFALLGLPGAAGGQLLRQSLGGDVDWYRTLRHKTSAVERVSLDAENVPLLKHAIDNTDFTSAEGASNGAFVLGVAATAATFDVLGDFLSIFGGLAEGVRALGVAKKAVALGKEAKLAGRSAEEVIRVVQESVGKSAFEVADLLEKEAAALPAKDSVLAARKRSAAETIRMRATEVVKSDAGGGNSVLTSLREIDQSTAIHPEEVRAALPQLKEEAKKATDAVNAITAERETLTAEREAAKATASPEDWDNELKAGFDASSRDVGARLRTAENRKLQFDTAVDSIESGRYDQVYDIANQQAKKGMVDELSLTGKGAVPATPVSALGFPEAPAPTVPPPPNVNEIVAAFGEDVTTVGGKTQRIVTAKTASEALIAARMGGKNTEAVEKLSKDLLVHMTASDPAVAQVVQRLRDADAARVASKGGKPASETQILQKALGKQTRDAAAQMAVKARQKVVQAEAKVEHIKRLQETNTQFAAQKKAFDVAQKNMEKILSEAEAASVAAETEAAAKRAAEAVPPAAPLKGKKKAAAVAPAPAEVAPVEVPPAPAPVITPTKVESVVGAPAGQAEVPDETGMLGRALETLSPLKAQQRRTRFDLSRLDFGPSGEPFLLPHMVYTPKAKYAARQQVHLAYLAFERDALAGTDKALGKYLVGAENADFARNNGLPHLDKYMTPTETYRFTASIDGAPPEPYNYYTVRKLDLNKQAAQAMPVYHTVTPGELTWTPAADAFLNDIAKVAAAHPERQTANTMNNFLRSLLPFSDVKAVEKDAHTLIRLEDQVRVDSVAAGNNIEAYRLPERKADEADAVMSKPAAFVGKVTGFTADGKVIVQPYEFRIGSRELDYTSPQRIKPVTVDPAEMRYQERGRRPRNRTMRTMTDAEWSELRAREDKMPGARTLRYDPSTTGWMQKLNPPARPTKDSYYFAVENLADDVDRQAALLEKHNALYRGVPTPAPGEVPLVQGPPTKPGVDVSFGEPPAPPVEPPAVAPKGKGKGKATPVAEPVVEPAKPPVAEPVAPKLPAGPTKAEIEAAEFELGMAQNELEKAREAKSARGKKVLAQKLQEAETAVEEAKRAHAAEQALQDATEKMEKVANDVLTPALGERIPVAEGLEKTRLGEEALAAFKERKARLLEMAGGNVPQTVTPARAIYEQQVREVYARLGRDPALADAQLQATNAIADAMHAQYPDEFPTTDAVYSRVVHEIGTKEQQAAEAAGFLAGTAPKLPHMTGTSLRGMANTADGTRTVLTFFANANAETLVHEPGHFLELVLPKKPKAIIEQALGVVDGNWTREQSEAFARQYTAFLLNGVQTGNVELDRSYSAISNSLKAVIKEGAAEVVHKDIADALTALTQFAEPASVRTVGGGGNRERLLREFDILTQIRNTGTGTGPVNTARVVAGKVRDMLFMNTQERALRSLAPEVRRVIVMSEAEFGDLNRVIAEHLGKDTLISAVLDENPDPTWWNAFRDAVFNKSLTDNYDNIAFAYLDAKRFGRFTPEDVTTLRKIVSSGEYTSAQDLADRVYAASEALAAKATNPEALRPRNVGDALLVQSVGGIGIDQNLLKRGFGIGMTISKDSAQKAKMVFAGVAADRTQEGMRIIQNAIDDPFNYDKPIEKLYDAGTAAGFFKETTTEPFVSAGKFATEFAVALDGEAYVPRAVKDIMEKRWKEIASAQKMSEGGQVFFRAWKQALTAGYACVKPWYHWQNMFSDIEQIGSTIGLEAAMRTAASATLHSLVLGLGGQRVVSGATDVAIIGAQKLASKTGITTWLESGAWKMGDTMKKLDEVLAFGAFGKPTTNVLERTGKFITKEGIEYDNAALAKIFSASGVYESGLGNLDLVGQLNRLDQTGRAARGEVGLAARAKQNVVEAWRMNAAQVGNIATLIARRRKIGLCLTLMDMGYEPYEAAMLVKKSLFDMKHTLHDSEKGMWAFFNPFWAWKKENAARSLQDVMTAGGLRRMSIIHKTRETTAQAVGYMLQTNPPTGFDVRSMKEDDQNLAESEKRWPKFQAILDSLHQPSEAYPQGLTDNDIKRMVAEPGWMTGNQPIAALAPYYSQYWMVNPTQAMLPDYVWDRVVIYATIPHTSDSYQLYTTGEGSKAQIFDQGRVVVLPEDVNMAGLEVSVAAASSVIHAMYWAQGDPGAKARFNASIKKVIGDPTTNPAFVAIVNGALSYEDPENPPRDVKLPPGWGEVLHTLGGDILSQVGKPVTTAGEGMGAEGQAKRTYTMPWLTDALLTGLDIAPIIKAPGTVENIYRAASGAVGVDAAESADIPYQVIELTTGQPIRTYSATQQQRSMRFQVDERVKEATAAFKPSAPLDEPIPQQPGAPTDRWLRFYQKVPLSATPSVDLDAYYEGTDTPKLIQQLAKTPGNESLLNVWKHWASVRAVAGIPKEQSNRGTFRQFYPIYLDALARDASAEELKNMLTVLDYNKYTQ